MYVYQGQVKVVKELVTKADSLAFDHSSTGYWSSSDRYELVRRELYDYVADTFPADWSYCMVVKLAPMGMLALHSDGPSKGNRYHVVLQSNDNAWTLHGGVWQQLDIGSVYLMDCTLPHAAVNWGSEPRIHLVIDTKECRL